MVYPSYVRDMYMVENVLITAQLVGTHRWRNTMIKIAIALLVVVSVISALIVCSCCIVAGRADDFVEQAFVDNHDDSKTSSNRSRR